MGLLAKAATKKRIQAVRGPLNPALESASWVTGSWVPAGALVRSAVFGPDIIGVFTELTLRHAPKLGPIPRSHLWVQMDGATAWALTLGEEAHDGTIATNWRVTVEALLDERTIIVDTAAWRTADDELIFGEHHDALRAEVLRALGTGRAAEGRDEVDFTRASLAIAQPISEELPDTVDASFTLRTSVGRAALQVLGRVGHVVLARSAHELTWGLGLPAHRTENWVTLTESGNGSGLDGVASIRSRSPASRRIAVRDLESFVSRAAFVLRQEDPDVAYIGPEQWAP